MCERSLASVEMLINGNLEMLVVSKLHGDCAKIISVCGLCQLFMGLGTLQLTGVQSPCVECFMC